MAAVARLGAVVLREAALWGAALLLHLLVAAAIARLMIGPRAAAPELPTLEALN